MLGTLFKSARKLESSTWPLFLRTYFECAYWLIQQSQADARRNIAEQVLREASESVISALLSSDKHPELLGRIHFPSYPESLGAFLIKVATVLQSDSSSLDLLFNCVFEKIDAAFKSSSQIVAACERIGKLLSVLFMSDSSADAVTSSVESLCARVLLRVVSSFGMSGLSSCIFLLIRHVEVESSGYCLLLSTMPFTYNHNVNLESFMSEKLLPAISAKQDAVDSSMLQLLVRYLCLLEKGSQNIWTQFLGCIKGHGVKMAILRSFLLEVFSKAFNRLQRLRPETALLISAVIFLIKR